jgi:molecular chaperone DnaJ
MTNQVGFMSVTVNCNRCAGTGRIISSPCKECHGVGTGSIIDDFSIKVPSGVDTGDRLKVEGRGYPGTGGMAPGDLLVRVVVVKSKKFRREAFDVHGTTTIPLTTSMLGGEVTIETIHGTEKVRIPEGTQPGSVLRLSDLGVPRTNSLGSGDHYAHVKVNLPGRLTAKQRECVKRLRDALNEGK